MGCQVRQRRWMTVEIEDDWALAARHAVHSLSSTAVTTQPRRRRTRQCGKDAGYRSLDDAGMPPAGPHRTERLPSPPVQPSTTDLVKGWSVPTDQSRDLSVNERWTGSDTGPATRRPTCNCTAWLNGSFVPVPRRTTWLDVFAGTAFEVIQDHHMSW